jgi:hypothetical protein
MNKERLFINRFFVTLALRPSVHGADKLVQLFKNKARAEAEADAIDADLLEALEDKARDFEKLMDRCSPRRLSIYGHNGLKFSETMEVAEMVMTGRHRRVPIIRGTSAARFIVNASCSAARRWRCAMPIAALLAASSASGNTRHPPPPRNFNHCWRSISRSC